MPISWEELDERAEEDEMLAPTGYRNCIIGIVERFGQPDILCIDKDRLLKQYMKDGMTEDEADEFFGFNTIGAWVGDRTPCFLTRVKGKLPRE